jgi:alanine dehydrogenase
LHADHGLEGACKKVPALTGGINVRDGKITYAAIGEAHGLPFEAPF